MLDHFDAGALGGIDHLERGLQAAFVVDADLGDDERRMRGADLSAGD